MDSLRLHCQLLIRSRNTQTSSFQLKISPAVPIVGRISEAPSDTVKYLANYYQHFKLSSGWKVP